MTYAIADFRKWQIHIRQRNDNPSISHPPPSTVHAIMAFPHKWIQPTHPANPDWE
jgi:hypothetical protein